MEDAIARLTDEQAEYALSLRGDLFWQYMTEVESGTERPD